LVLERTLDGIYFSRVWELVRQIRSMRNLVGEEIDLRNLLAAFSLKTRTSSSRLIEETIIPPFYTIAKRTLHSLLERRLEDAPNIVSRRYSNLASEVASLIKSNSQLPLEWLFFKRLYSDATVAARTNSLQAGYIVAYLLLCECEAKNLVSIVTGKQLKLSDEQISKGIYGV
jgi:vacuolar-type H+-ATPase subunit C/Vma6